MRLTIVVPDSVVGVDGINGYVGTRGGLPSNWVGGRRAEAI